MKRPDRKLALAAAALMVAAAAAAATAAGPQPAPRSGAGILDALEKGDSDMPFAVQKRLVSWGGR